MKRTDILKALTVAKPALASREVIPIFCHFCFDGQSVRAYNDIIGIQTVCETDFDGTVHGNSLMNFLSLSRAKKLKTSIKDGMIKFSAGSHSLNLPLVPREKFLFEFPKAKKILSVRINEFFIECIKRCMISVNTDSYLLEQMGITIVLDDSMVFYSTDSTTITKQVVRKKIDVEKRHVIVIPTDFCKALLSVFGELGKTSKGELVIGKDYVIARFGDDCVLFSRLVEVKALDFEKVISKTLSGFKSKNMIKIPSGFINSLNQATVFLGQSSHAVSQKRKISEWGVESCKFSVTDDRLRMKTRTSYGKVRGATRLKESHPDAEISVDPSLLARVIDLCDKIYILDKTCFVLKRKNYLHLVAAVSEA